MHITFGKLQNPFLKSCVIEKTCALLVVHACVHWQIPTVSHVSFSHRVFPFCSAAIEGLYRHGFGLRKLHYRLMRSNQRSRQTHDSNQKMLKMLQGCRNPHGTALPMSLFPCCFWSRKLDGFDSCIEEAWRKKQKEVRCI